MKGFVCPHCPGVQLRTYRVRKPCAGRVVRYRECPRCGYRECTVERRSHVLPAKVLADGGKDADSYKLIPGGWSA